MSDDTRGLRGYDVATRAEAEYFTHVSLTSHTSDAMFSLGKNSGRVGKQHMREGMSNIGETIPTDNPGD